MTEGGGVYRGTSLAQDIRYANKEKKLMASMKFPTEYSTKVDMKKVTLDVIKPWIAQQITKLLGFEDEVLIGYVYGLLEEKQFPDPKYLQVSITGFLEHDSSDFCRELWKVLISAQNSIGGIPPQFLAKKKLDILNRKAESDRIKAELARRRPDGNEDSSETTSATDLHDNGEAEKKKAEEVAKTIQDINKKFKDQKWEEEQEENLKKRSRSGEREKERERPSKDRKRSNSRERRREKRRSSSRERRRRSSSRDRRRSSSRERRSYRSDSRERRRDDRGDRHRRYNDDRRRDERRRSDSGDDSSKRRSDSPVSNEKNTDDLEKELREKALASMVKKEDD